MKLSAWQKRLYTADYYKPVYVDGGTQDPMLTHEFDKQIKGNLVVQGAVFIYWTCDEFLIPTGQLRNIRDRDGELVLPLVGNTSMTYELTEPIPVVNVLGFRETTRYKAKRVETPDGP